MMMMMMINSVLFFFNYKETAGEWIHPDSH